MCEHCAVRMKTVMNTRGRYLGVYFIRLVWWQGFIKGRVERCIVVSSTFKIVPIGLHIESIAKIKSIQKSLSLTRVSVLYIHTWFWTGRIEDLFFFVPIITFFRYIFRNTNTKVLAQVKIFICYTNSCKTLRRKNWNDASLWLVFLIETRNISSVFRIETFRLPTTSFRIPSVGRKVPRNDWKTFRSIR